MLDVARLPVHELSRSPEAAMPLDSRVSYAVFT